MTTGYAGAGFYMREPLGQRRFSRWCEKHGLDLSQAVFHTPMCYYGIRFRTRPGALVIYHGLIVHQSYAWTDTFLAAFEPTVRVEIPLAEVTSVDPISLSFVWRVGLGNPKSAFRVVANGHTHEFVFWSQGTEFAGTIKALRNSTYIG